MAIQDIISKLNTLKSLLESRPNDAQLIEALKFNDEFLNTTLDRSISNENVQLQEKVNRERIAAEALAEAAVEKCIISKLQDDVDAAQTLVTNLTNGEVKTALQTKLTLIQTQITDSQTALQVDSAFEVALQNQIDSVTAIVNSLPPGTEKDNLITSLNTMKAALLERIAQRLAYNAVTIAVASRKQEDIDAAQLLIDAVGDPTIKAALQLKLNTVKP